MEREAIERANAGTGVLRELQRTHEHGHDHMDMDPQSPSLSVSAVWSASAHARSLPSTDINPVSADETQAQACATVDDGVGTGAVEVFGRVVSVDAASSISPRVDIHSPDEITVRAQAQAASPPASALTPLMSVNRLASTSESRRWAEHPESELKPDSALEEIESSSDLEGALRSEAYGWPRLVFPPLKKSGHIIIDACTREGSLTSPFSHHFFRLSNSIISLDEYDGLILMSHLDRKDNATDDSEIAR